jgi:antitoxin component HigA of HigAB toxin-antitoxin module
MEIRPIRIEADYQAAQAVIEALLNTEAGSPEVDRLEVLSRLAEAWEGERFPDGSMTWSWRSSRQNDR